MQKLLLWYLVPLPMFGFIKQVIITILCFSRSLASTANVSNFAKCISLNNQSCMIRPALIELNSDECNQDYVNINLWLI